MKLKIVKTTDGKFLGKEFDVPAVTPEVCNAMGIAPTSITWRGDTCIVQNANYTVKLLKTED